MSKCPHCGEIIAPSMGLSTAVATSHGIGDAPYQIPVLLISCSRPDCGKVLGVLHPVSVGVSVGVSKG